jgi:hypothetical protein
MVSLLIGTEEMVAALVVLLRNILVALLLMELITLVWGLATMFGRTPVSQLRQTRPYTLTVAAGNRNPNFSGVGNASTYAILAGGTNLGAASYANTAAVIGDANLTLASGSVDASTFAASSFGDGDALVFTTGATVPNENLVVLLGDNSPTGRSHFDNVRLDAVAAVPEVSSALLGSLAALFLLRRRR